MKQHLFLIFILSFTSTSALKCYVCSTGAGEEDRSCIENPSAFASSAINCKKRYCTTSRQEYQDPSGVVASFGRGCEDAPIHINEDIEEQNYKYFYRACSKDLCNNGTGTEPIGSENLGQNIGPAGVLLVPGTGASSSLIVSTILMFLPILIILRNQ